MDIAQSIGLSVVEERQADGNPLLEDGEQILESFEDIQLILASDADQGLGKVFITEERIVWLSCRNSSLGFTVNFHNVSMHALATDSDAGDRPCMYVQLDNGDEDEGRYDDEDDEESSFPPLPELRLIPGNPATLDAMFKAFCDGAERNPDVDAEEEGQGNLFFNREEILAGAFDTSLDVDDVDELVGSGDPERFGDPDEGDDFEEFENRPENGY